MERESFDDLNANSKLKLPKDVGLYWIHCNRCFEIYIRKRRRIFLLSCNHMICEKCATTLATNHINVTSEVNCPICKNIQRYRVLCNVMPAHAKELLNPEPWREPNERILNFQTRHRESFKKEMFRMVCHQIITVPLFLIATQFKIDVVYYLVNIIVLKTLAELS